ncbi:MAG TPA: type II CAAX endopeptidase family protein [Candidatus Limnocylindrales bacterium]|nr:type II CAAX endopeptidase family protein [Candidatus Limnocylindrales bacterium]
MATLVRSHPLIAYSVLAFAFSLVLTLLLNVSLAFGLLALFGPAAAALIVSRVWRGRAGMVELWAVTKRWRVHPVWYVAALALPAAGFALAHVVYVAAGNPIVPVPGSIQPIMLLLFVLVIGEEIGWRGFLLRHLLHDRPPLVAAILVGVVWVLWHSPLYFIPGMPSYGGPFLAFAAWAMSLSFLLTWLWMGTRSVVLATVMHGAANLAPSLVFPVTDSGVLFGFGAIGTGAVAAVVVALTWHRWVGSPDPERSFGSAPAT